MSKIIIHNKTYKTDEEILKYVCSCYKEIPNFVHFIFNDKVNVQFIQQKTCKTFYVCGGSGVENEK